MSFASFARLARRAFLGIVICWLVFVAESAEVVRNEDICGPRNGRRVYLELGEKGILYAKNVSFAKNEPRQQQQEREQTSSGMYSRGNSSHEQCSLELVTCPSCVIIVTFRSLALSHHCGDGGVTMDNPCRCDYVWISEPPYEDVSGTPFCGLYAPLTYRSSTRTLSIVLLYSQSHKHAFSLDYTAERNRLHLKGTELSTAGAKGLNSTGGGILTSPFFPARYPRDLGIEYIVTCPSEAPSCRIRLLFSDFQLATVSIMEFYDWNGQRLDVSSGSRFRPPVIVSSGPSLLIRFYANGGTGLGYKAFYSFVVGHLFDKSVQPITDCGGYVENLGGAITMIDMVGEGVKTYDCVWLIRPPKNFLHMKTHMYLKVITFADMAGNTELVIKQGPTSALLPLEVLRHPTRQLQPPRHREHIAAVTSGFHVSLRGTFGPLSHLAIAYAAFSYMDCFAGSDFLCQNHRCIPTQLNCDGFDHCGDNSDEPATCFRDWEVEPQDRKWHVNKANYYFPKIDRYPDLKTATLVFVASSLGLIVLISALIILLYRMGARARQQRELQSRLQTISELLDGARIDEISVSDEPPVYEAPPGYDEVVKLSLEADGVARKKRRSIGRESRIASSPSQRPSDLGGPGRSALDATASTSRGSQTTPISALNDPRPRTRCLPESPPPPYVTPPGTIPRSFLRSLLPSSSASGDSSETAGGEGEEEKEAGAASSDRRWLRYAAEFPRSPTAQQDQQQQQQHDPSASSAGAFSSIDAEIVGAYLRDGVVSGPTDASDATIHHGTSFDPQPRSSLDASIDASNDTDGNSGAEREETVAKRAEETGGGTEAVGDGAVEERNFEESPPAGCSCEGACGCANDRRSISGVVVDSGTGRTLRDRERRAAREVRCKSSSVERESANESLEESLSRSKSTTTIVKLLSSRAGRSQSAYSTNASTPCGTLVRKSSRKFSVCSRDSYVTKISSIGSCSSYEKLQDEFEIVSEAASVLGYTNPSTMTNTPSGTPRSLNGPRRCRRSRRYSSCDLESLYEGIKVLDSFLARRGLSVAHARKQSVAVMLFGTPEHGAARQRRAPAPEMDDYEDVLDNGTTEQAADREEENEAVNDGENEVSSLVDSTTARRE